MKNNIADTYLEHELEKALMDESDRDVLFQFEGLIIDFINDEGNKCLIVERDGIEIEFKNKIDKNLAMLVLRRYVQEFKVTNCDNDENVIIKDLLVSFNKKCRINKPILRLTDFYDKVNREIRTAKKFIVK
jgi:hypothetical protein